MRTEKDLSAHKHGLCAQKSSIGTQTWAMRIEKFCPNTNMGYAHRKVLSAHKHRLCGQKSSIRTQKWAIRTEKFYPHTKMGYAHRKRFIRTQTWAMRTEKSIRTQTWAIRTEIVLSAHKFELSAQKKVYPHINQCQPHYWHVKSSENTQKRQFHHSKTVFFTFQLLISHSSTFFSGLAAGPSTTVPS